jgi:hypothetical protein
MTTIFDYDKALAIVQSNPLAKDFLEKNRARLEELGTEIGQAALLEIINLFAAGKNLEAWSRFYNRDVSWAALGQGATEDVANTAAMAQRWADLGSFIGQCGVLAAKALLAVLVAGFCG